MADLLQEYKDYYSVRYKRYDGNPNYKHSYQAEKKISDAMQSCNTLDEFKDKLGNLNHLCGIAYIKDKLIMENKLFNEFEEIVRAKSSEKILAKIDQYSDIGEAMSFQNQEEVHLNQDIMLDEANRVFIECWDLLDQLEIYENAKVPSEYKSMYDEFASDIKKSIRDLYQDTKEKMDMVDKKWKHNPDVIMESRHKRLLPYKDETIKEQLAKYKKIINL